MLGVLRYFLHGEERFRPGHPVQLLLFFFNNCRQGHAFNLIEEFESFLSNQNVSNKIKTQVKNLCRNKHASINTAAMTEKYTPYPNLAALQTAFQPLLNNNNNNTTANTDTTKKSSSDDDDNLFVHLYITVHYLKVLIALQNKNDSSAVKEEVLRYYALGLQWLEHEKDKSIGEDVQEEKNPSQQEQPQKEQENEQKNEQINALKSSIDRKHEKAKLQWKMLWFRWRALFTFYVGQIYFVHNETKTAFTWFQNASAQYPMDRPLKIQGACIDAMSGKYESSYNGFIAVIKSMDQNIEERIEFHKNNNTKQSSNKQQSKRSKRSKYSRNDNSGNTLSNNSIFSTDDAADESLVELLRADQTEPYVPYKYPFKYPYEHCNAQEKKFISYKLIAHIGCCAILLLDRSYRWENWWPKTEVLSRDGWRAYLNALTTNVTLKKPIEERWDMLRQHIREAIHLEPSSVILKYVASYAYYQCDNIEMSQKYYDHFVKAVKKSNKKLKSDKTISKDTEIDLSHFRWSPQHEHHWKVKLEMTINMLISIILIVGFYLITGYHPHMGNTKGEQLIVVVLLTLSCLLVSPPIGLLCMAISLPTTRDGSTAEALNYFYFGTKLIGTLLTMHITRQIWN